MSKKIVDIGTQSTVEKILDAVPGNVDFNPVVTVNRDEVHDRFFRVGKIPNCSTTDSPVVLFYNDNVYVIPHKSTSVYLMTNDSGCWKDVLTLPFEIDVYNTRVLVFYNPNTKKHELHILGGPGRLSRTHFKYDLEGDGGFVIASELPYDFCAGKAVVFNKEIHIFGGGTANFTTSVEEPEGFINNHYKWNGLTWEEASELTRSCYGATPFVLENELHLIGGKTALDDDSNAVPVYEFTESTKSWYSRGVANLGIVPYHASVVTSRNEFILIGGLRKAFQTKVSVSKGMYGAIAYNIVNTSIDGVNTSFCHSGQSATIDELTGTVYSASNGFLYISNGAEGHPYKTVTHPTELTNTNWDLLTIDNSLVIATLDKDNRSLVSLDSGTTVYPTFNMTKHCIVENDYGDIYMFNDSTDSKLAVAYLKTTKNGTVNYVPHTFALPIDIENPYVCWYDGKFHILGRNRTGYNHCTIKDYESEFNATYVANINLPASGDIVKRSMCVHNGKMYYAYIDEQPGSKCIHLYQFDGNRWTYVCKEYLYYSFNFDFQMVSFQNKLFLLIFNYALVDYTLDFYLKVLVNDKFITLNSCNLDSYLSTAKAIVYNNSIQIVTTDYYDKTKTNRYALQYSFSNSTGVDTYEIFLDEGRVFVCDKTKVVPILGYVEEVSTGFKALSTGKYTFIKISSN